MGTRLLCPALDAMLKKTIIALCEVNVQYNLTLEISGSLHIRADGERVFNCLIEEELNGTGIKATAMWHYRLCYFQETKQAKLVNYTIIKFHGVLQFNK